MRTTVLLMVVVLFAITCHGALQRAQPQVLRLGVPADHFLSIDAGFVATDLSHGNGPMHLALERRWNGSATLNTRFGRGWSDQNDLQLRLLNPNFVVILRGGVGWRDAYKKTDALFESAAGEKIERTDKGWTAHMPDGVTLTFDTDGRLLAQSEAEGPSCTYTYDGKGRLISLGTGPGNLLRAFYNIAVPPIRYVPDDRWQFSCSTML